MRELLFRERFTVARNMLLATYEAPTVAQWELLDKIVAELKEPIPRELRGFKKWYVFSRSFRSTGATSAADFALVCAAFDNMRRFCRYDPPEPPPLPFWRRLLRRRSNARIAISNA